MSRGAVEAGDGAAEAERGSCALARHRADERDGEEQQERPEEP